MLWRVRFALMTALAVGLRGDAPVKATEPVALWINSPTAKPWLPALTDAAQRTGLPVALIAELIGQESGFRNIRSTLPGSSAKGFGQQIDGNTVMIRYRLNPMRPADSILGAAIELRERLDRTGSLPAALRGYGTTAGRTSVQRKTLLARFDRAMLWVPAIDAPARPGAQLIVTAAAAARSTPLP
jgi:soluble lytic murein transglycosylase-like protein